MDRRQFLATGLGAVGVSVAGCTALTGETVLGPPTQQRDGKSIRHQYEREGDILLRMYLTVEPEAAGAYRIETDIEQPSDTTLDRYRVRFKPETAGDPPDIYLHPPPAGHADRFDTYRDAGWTVIEAEYDTGRRVTTGFETLLSAASGREAPPVRVDYEVGFSEAGYLGSTYLAGHRSTIAVAGVASRDRSQDDSASRYLKEDETPESAGAREFLGVVAEETDGLARFKGDGDTWRVGFSEGDETWEIKYRGNPHSGDDRFREEIAELSTAFASHRPDGVSLEATSLHECTTGTWQVRADLAAAYERGELDRTAFVDRVQETAETVNNC